MWWSALPRVGGLQRALVIAVLAPVVLALVPAMALEPFLPGCTGRTVRLLSAAARYVGALARAGGGR
ncbi:hypothetical protein ABZX95_45030 [Streptomyces sp. NPDC004232]|uniref:hypothetical protein n=1 Tax=Streptomyces sp. NPDC004232 TaxID=3154454 RepID=UPI0033B58F40